MYAESFLIKTKALAEGRKDHQLLPAKTSRKIGTAPAKISKVSMVKVINGDRVNNMEANGTREIKARADNGIKTKVNVTRECTVVKVAKETTVMAGNPVNRIMVTKTNGTAETRKAEANGTVSMVKADTAKDKMIGAVMNHLNNSVEAVQDNSADKVMATVILVLSAKAALNMDREVGVNKIKMAIANSAKAVNKEEAMAAVNLAKEVGESAISMVTSLMAERAHNIMAEEKMTKAIMADVQAADSLMMKITTAIMRVPIMEAARDSVNIVVETATRTNVMAAVNGMKEQEEDMAAKNIMSHQAAVAVLNPDFQAEDAVPPATTKQTRILTTIITAVIAEAAEALHATGGMRNNFFVA
jgi:hypothetical protein